MNVLASVASLAYRQPAVGGDLIPGIVFRYSPTSLTDLTAATGQTITLNGGCAVQSVDGQFCLRNATANGANFARSVLSSISTAAWTIACWIKVESNQPVSDWINITTEAGQVPSNEPLASIRARTANSTISGVQYSGSQRILTGLGFGLNQWYHSALTFDGNTLRLYISGSLTTTLTSVPAWTLTPTRFHMMGSSIKSDSIVQGSGRDFRVYSRALDAAEVAQVCNGVV